MREEQFISSDKKAYLKIGISMFFSKKYSIPFAELAGFILYWNLNTNLQN